MYQVGNYLGIYFCGEQGRPIFRATSPDVCYFTGPENDRKKRDPFLSSQPTSMQRRKPVSVISIMFYVYFQPLSALINCIMSYLSHCSQPIPTKLSASHYSLMALRGVKIGIIE